MEAPSFSELLRRDIGAVSKVGPEVRDPHADGKLEVGYCSAGDNRLEWGMLMGEVVGNKSSSCNRRNSSMPISRPRSPCCDEAVIREQSGLKVLAGNWGSLWLVYPPKLLRPAVGRLFCIAGGAMGLCPLETNGLGLGPGREMLDLDRIMGAAAEDPVACVVFERFIGRLWSCGRVSKSGADTEYRL
jgi:hypothetical protein